MLAAVHPPDDETPESWLQQFDSTPTLVPDRLPQSTRMALVVVYALPHDGGTCAMYVQSEEALANVSSPAQYYGLGRLFFTVPKTILQGPGVCPALAPRGHVD